MRRLGAALAMVLLVAGCGGTARVPSSHDTPAPVTTSAQPQQADRLSLANYHRLVRNGARAGWSSFTDSQLDTVGRKVCTVLDVPSASAVAAAYKAIHGFGLTPRQTGGFLVYAASAFCPTKVDALKSL